MQDSLDGPSAPAEDDPAGGAGMAEQAGSLLALVLFLNATGSRNPVSTQAAGILFSASPGQQPPNQPPARPTKTLHRFELSMPLGMGVGIRRGPDEPAPPPEPGPLAEDEPAGVWVCDECGEFSGPFHLVAAHEASCRAEAVVTRLLGGGAAAAAGVKVGDVIVELGAATRAKEIVRALGELRRSEEVFEFVVARQTVEPPAEVRELISRPRGQRELALFSAFELLCHQASVAEHGLYDARMHVLLHLMASWLELPWSRLGLWEDSLAARVRSKMELTQNESEGLQQRQRSRMQWLKVGAAGLIGGAAMFLTGGMAAPAVGSGMVCVQRRSI